MIVFPRNVVCEKGEARRTAHNRCQTERKKPEPPFICADGDPQFGNDDHHDTEQSKLGQELGRRIESDSDIDVCQMMKKLGGGGHFGSAAALVKDDNLNDVIMKLENIVRGI